MITKVLWKSAYCSNCVLPRPTQFFYLIFRNVLLLFISILQVIPFLKPAHYNLYEERLQCDRNAVLLFCYVRFRFPISTASVSEDFIGLPYISHTIATALTRIISNNGWGLCGSQLSKQRRMNDRRKNFFFTIKRWLDLVFHCQKMD